MAELDEQFDAESQEPAQFELIPTGTEVAMIAINSEMKTTNDFTGKYIAWEFHLADPPYEGRKIFQNMTWKNQNPKAEQIGRSQFADLCRAVGVLNPTDTAQCHNIHFIGRIGIEKGKNGYQDRNKVTAFYAIDANGQAVKPAHSAQPVAAAPSAPARPSPAPVAQAPRAAAAPGRPLPATATGKPAWSRPQQQAAAAPG